MVRDEIIFFSFVQLVHHFSIIVFVLLYLEIDWAKPNQVINIPNKIVQDLNQYNATLGHLINHSKKPNVWFGMVDHIRFGKIRSIVMLKDVSANQELFVSSDCSLIKNTRNGTLQTF